MSEYRERACALLSASEQDYGIVGTARNAQAQAYATLELAEQQRLANLIALHKSGIIASDERAVVEAEIRQGLMS